MPLAKVAEVNNQGKHTTKVDEMQREGRGMVEIDMSIHDIINESDGTTLIDKNGAKVKILLNEQERQLLIDRLAEKV